jgi:hypothetical protein
VNGLDKKSLFCIFPVHSKGSPIQATNYGETNRSQRIAELNHLVSQVWVFKAINLHYDPPATSASPMNSATNLKPANHKHGALTQTPFRRPLFEVVKTETMQQNFRNMIDFADKTERSALTTLYP